MNFQLRSYRVMCVAGPSQSGKTEFILRLLESKEEELFRNPLNKVLWCFGIHNPNLQAQLQSKGYKVHRGLPTEADIEPNSICILDDPLSESETLRKLQICVHERRIISLVL